MGLEKLKIFISWSGERSRAVAEALRDWLPNVLFMAEPWLSAADIEKGAKWNQVVSGELEKSNFAVICLTADNLGAPWLLFEAGALSKRAESRVCTYLYGLEYPDVKDPLSQFQHTMADEAETKRLVETINKHLGDAALQKDRLDKMFDKWWPDLKAALEKVPASDPKAGPSDDRKRVPEMMAEILERVREQGRELRRLRSMAEETSVRRMRHMPSLEEAEQVARRVQRKFLEAGFPLDTFGFTPDGLQVGDQRVPWSIARLVADEEMPVEHLVPGAVRGTSVSGSPSKEVADAKGPGSG